MTTLANIRTKVRRLTGHLSVQQITDDEIDEYINTFLLYDLPEELRLFTLTTNFEFMTIPNVDTYDMRTMQVTTNSGTQNAVDVYYNISSPAYCAGYQMFWSQDQEQFYRIYPNTGFITTTLEGDGTPGPYAFSLSDVPVLQYNVNIGTVDDTNATVQVEDVPTDPYNATWQLVNTSTAVTGSFDYTTGVGTITFSNNIPTGNEITITSVPYRASRPMSLLFFDNVITLRPVPDRSYPIQVQAFKVPSQLLEDSSSPPLLQWWQYIAYGASKKIFEDTGDPEGGAGIMQGFNEQEQRVLRRHIVQQTSQRAATIYTEQDRMYYGSYWPQW